ncbi:MAG: flavodoxin family protein [Deltaproteobacteria bacterium]|nr:flavodoxin family protein [Deltaproteobacteria bacterium]
MPENENGFYVETENERQYLAGNWKKPSSVLGIHASSRAKRGATALFYDHLKAGMEKASARVSTVHLAEKKFNPCSGCFKCWTQKLGHCPIQDDITELLAAIPDYDIMVLATPLYIDGMSGLLKNFIDRSMFLNHPAVINHKGRCLHPCRFQSMPNLVLLGVCAYYEIEHFDPLVQHVEALAVNMHMPLTATLLRPETMSLMDRSAIPKLDVVKSAFEEAGEMIIKTGKISDNLAGRVSAPFLSREKYFQNSKAWYKGQKKEKNG